PGRRRWRAPRPPPSPAASGGDPSPDSIPPDLGRDPAGPRPADRDPARATPAAGVQHEDAPLDEHLPGGRLGGGGLAVRRRAREARAVRAARSRGVEGPGRGGRTPGPSPSVTVSQITGAACSRSHQPAGRTLLWFGVAPPWRHIGP